MRPLKQGSFKRGNGSISITPRVRCAYMCEQLALIYFIYVVLQNLTSQVYCHEIPDTNIWKVLNGMSSDTEKTHWTLKEAAPRLVYSM